MWTLVKKFENLLPIVHLRDEPNFGTTILVPFKPGGPLGQDFDSFKWQLNKKVENRFKCQSGTKCSLRAIEVIYCMFLFSGCVLFSICLCTWFMQKRQVHNIVARAEDTQRPNLF